VGAAIIGLSQGMLLFLLAAGLTLIFGLLGVVNLAHGSLYMIGAYVAFQVARWSGDFWLALLVSPLAGAAVGAAMEWLTFRPLYRREHYFQFLCTLGSLLVLDECVRMIWGLDYQRVDPPAVLAGSLMVLGLEISTYRLFIIGFGALLCGALFLVLERTTLGIVVRAANSNSTMVACLGLDVSRVKTGVVAFGAALAALAGAIAAPLIPVEPTMGFSIIIDCFVVVIVGGLGNIGGAVFAALLLGMTRAFGEQFVPDWIGVLTYGVLVLTLLLRPQGVFGKGVRAS